MENQNPEVIDGGTETPRLVECRMALYEESVNIVNELHAELGHASRADTFKYAIAHTHSIVMLLKAGGEVRLVDTNGEEYILTVERKDGTEIRPTDPA